MAGPQVRKIIHVDMDMFYAAVELRDRPDLRGLPLVVGGPPASRSVVTTATYEARKFGIRSGMSCAEARRRCPVCLFLPPSFGKYERVSQQIRAVFLEFTDLVEPVSLDEAYLDVTENKVGECSATRIAREIKRRIVERTGLTASAGVGPSMFVAKLASEHRKPDGLFTVPPGRVLDFIRPLKTIQIPGVGRKTEAALAALGLHTVADLAARSGEFLQAHFGKFGSYLFDIARGIDERPVTPVWERRSYGAEETFPSDVLAVGEVWPWIVACAERAFAGMTERGMAARTVTLKIKYHDFRMVTRRRTLDRFLTSVDEVVALARELLQATEAGRVRIRLAGVSLSTFTASRRSPGREMGGRPLFPALAEIGPEKVDLP
jgi:DNA polymerase IV